MHNSKFLSIIIVNYNTGKLLFDCVKSIYAESGFSDFEIIIIDNASRDDSLMRLKKEYLDIRIIINKENLGFAKAVNQALDIANKEFILLLNPDTVMLSGCLEKMVTFLQNNPKAGACGPAIYKSDNNLQMSCHHFPRLVDIFFDKSHLNKIFRKNSLFGRYQMSYWNHDSIKQVDWLTGACFMIRAALLREINGLDPRFFMFCEDIDLCIRVKEKGFKIFYLPQAKIIHHKSGSSNIVKNKPPVISWESLIIFWKKHYNPFSVVCLKLVLKLDALIKIAVLKTQLLNHKSEKYILEEIDYFDQVLKILNKP